MFKDFYNNALEEGLYFAPSQYEANFMSSVHSENDINKTISGIINSLQK